MPRNASGTYTLPIASFIAGTTILSASMNSNLSDIASALTESLATTGVSSMTGPIKLAAGTSAAPAISLASDTGTGWYNSAAGTWSYVTSNSTIMSIAPTGVTVGNMTVTNLTVTGSFSVAANRLVGEIVDYGGTTAPSLWLLAYGQAISRTTYASLFGVIGTSFGSGDGSTTFNVPDLRGRYTAGKDDMGGVAANRITNAVSGITGITLGATGGLQSVTIAIANLPAHTHSVSVSGTTAGSGSLDHTHNFTYQLANVRVNASLGGTSVLSDTTASSGNVTGGVNTAGNLDHTHTFTASSTSGSTGSGTALGSLPPTVIVNKIIYAAV